MERLNGSEAPAAEALEAYQQIASGVDSGLALVLARLLELHPDHPEAILAGAINALVKFTFTHCITQLRMFTVVGLIELWRPIVKFAAEQALQKELRADG